MAELLRDPTTHTAAALAGWTHPWSREAAALADLYDATTWIATDRSKRTQWKPYPRPYRRRQDGERSAAPLVDQATIRAALAARGH